MTWSIKNSVQDRLPEGEYILRVEKFTPKKASENAKNPNAPMLNMRLVVDDESNPLNGKSQFQSFTLIPASIGILASFLAATGCFDLDDENDDNLPDDNEQLAAVLNDRLGGKRFVCDVKHSGDRFANVTCKGPAGMEAFA